MKAPIVSPKSYKYKSKFGKKDHNVVSHMKRAGILGDKLILNKHGLSLLQNNNITGQIINVDGGMSTLKV